MLAHYSLSAESSLLLFHRFHFTACYVSVFDENLAERICNSSVVCRESRIELLRGLYLALFLSSSSTTGRLLHDRLARPRPARLAMVSGNNNVQGRAAFESFGTLKPFGHDA